MGPPRFTSVGTLAAISLLTGLAYGADKSPYAVRAEALFDEGRRLMSAGDFASACPKFADSQALDPAPGTALNLAFCYEREGKIASAWAAFRTAEATARAAGQKDRSALAKKKADALELTLSRLTVSVPSPVQIAGLEVRSDGELVEPPEWGVAIPRDGGSFDIVATAPGKKTWTTHVDLEPTGKDLVVEVPPLEDVPPPPITLPPPNLSNLAPTAGGSALDLIERDIAANSPPVPVRKTPRGTTQRLVGLAIGGVGILGMGAAGVVGLTAKSKFTTAESEGPPGHHDESVFAFNTGNSATIVLGAGAIVTLVGAGIWLAAPTGTSVTVGTNGSTVLVRGSFR
jgi:hypothetical protein